jgi:hypothetical protein
MFTFTNAYGTRTSATNGELATADVINRQFTVANGADAQLTLLGNSTQLISTSTSVSLIANQQVHVVMNNTANATVTLPSASTSKKAIRIEKGANNFTTVTVNRAGSDTISNPFGAIATPVGTSFVLYLPGETYDFIPCGTFWRVYPINVPVSQCRSEVARISTNQTLTLSGSPTTFVLDWNSEVEDIGSNFNISTDAFVVPFNGYYEIDANTTISATATGFAEIFIALGGVLRDKGDGVELNIGGFKSLNVNRTLKLTAGNSIDLRVVLYDVSGTVQYISQPRATFQLVSRY